MNIYGDRVILRGVEESDIEMLRDMMNDPDTEHMTVGHHFPQSKAAQAQWFAHFSNDEKNQRWIIEVRESGEAIGLIAITDIDWKSRDATYGIKLKANGPRGKGYASDSELAMMRFVFEEMGLHRLSSSVLAYNAASIRMTENCGAKREGLKRKAVFKGGKWHDLILYGVLYEDFLEAKNRLNWGSAPTP